MHAKPIAPRSIGVLVPNWNDARYLPRGLDSLLGQEVPPDELIIVDDCSTDDSVAAIKRRIANEPRARLVENPGNLGTNGPASSAACRIEDGKSSSHWLARICTNAPETGSRC